ncbi:alpha/beta fold hydrolase [Pseudomonas sp. B22129]|uniref:alpha/beta fold hydrolase n=1 Tax=Pseudomonas sp. B22129 TaxID=3235111 RepID=UPI003783869D
MSYVADEAVRAISGILLKHMKDPHVIKQRALAVGICVAGLLAIGACATKQPPVLGIRWLPDCEGRPISGLDPEVVARTRCGIVTVPLDHSTPSRGTLSLDITRVAALQPHKREGSIFTNPGGPGADGSGFTVLLAAIWKGYGDKPGGEAYRHLTNTYDLIGITPRGMGSSPDSQLVCQSDEMMVAQNDLTEDRSPANLEALRHNVGVLARGCASQRLAPYISTEQTARDMEFVRVQLHEKTLNYFGNSYGTWLGAWYAGLFPGNVGRMVLDSNTDWTSTFQNASLSQAAEKERIFTRFVAQPAADNPQAYQMGNDPMAVREVFLNLLPQVRVALRSDNELYSSIAYLMAARALSQWLRDSPTLEDAALEARAQDYRFSPDTEVDQSAKRAFAHLLSVTRQPAPWNGIAPGPLKLDPATSVRSTLLCNDTAASGEKFWTEREDEYATRLPVGGGYFQARHCAAWSGKTLPGVPVRNLAKASSIVMVQAEFDDQTPADGALKAFRSVPNTHMILLKGAYQHGVSFSDLSACVNRTVGDYLAYGLKPGRLSICYASD